MKINEKNIHDNNALHFATTIQKLQGCSCCARSMDSANSTNNNNKGETAVMVALRQGHEEDLCELVKHEGVDTFMFDKLTHVCLDIGNGLGVGNRR